MRRLKAVTIECVRCHEKLTVAAENEYYVLGLIGRLEWLVWVGLDHLDGSSGVLCPLCRERPKDAASNRVNIVGDKCHIPKDYEWRFQ